MRRILRALFVDWWYDDLGWLECPAVEPWWEPTMQQCLMTPDQQDEFMALAEAIVTVAEMKLDERVKIAAFRVVLDEVCGGESTRRATLKYLASLCIQGL